MDCLPLVCRFYVEDYRLLTDHITVEQYYFQAKQGICYVSIIVYLIQVVKDSVCQYFPIIWIDKLCMICQALNLVEISH